MAFGVALLVLVAAGGVNSAPGSARTVLWGLGGAAVLCAVPLWHRLQVSGLDVAPHRFAVWAAVVILVALAEELLLRGALFAAVARGHGENWAIAVSAGAFAALHVPIYGWAVLPLDVAVGVVLGVLRVLAGSVTAPAIAHIGADLAGWWLR